MPPPRPTEADCGRPTQTKRAGNFCIYTDASAARPKDPCLRRAACAFWVGDGQGESAAWSLPGPVQTVYRAELFALLVAVEIFRGDLVVVSDCKGVVDEAERIRKGGAPSPTSRHADLWARLGSAMGRGGVGP